MPEKSDLDLKNLDRRVAARMVRKGQLSEKELEKALKQLPDVETKGEVVDTFLDDDDFED